MAHQLPKGINAMHNRPALGLFQKLGSLLDDHFFRSVKQSYFCFGSLFFLLRRLRGTRRRGATTSGSRLFLFFGSGRRTTTSISLFFALHLFFGSRWKQARRRGTTTSISLFFDNFIKFGCMPGRRVLFAPNF